MDRFSFLFSVICVFILVGCKSDSKVESLESQNLDKKYKVSPLEKSIAYNDATLGNMTYQSNTFSFEVGGSSYKLGEQTADAPQKMCANSGEGQHIHLIVGSKPYVAKYESRFEHSLADGTYNVLAFLSRSYHESIKNGKAHLARRITVSGGSMTESVEITEPMLFFSRPKGTYVGADTKKILIDFFPVNADIGKDYLIKVQINGEITMVDRWQPYFVEGLPYGTNSVGIALVYPDGSAVPGTQTAVLQTIILEEDPLPATN